MDITWDDLTVNIDHVDSEMLVKHWRWLIGDNMTPIMVSAIGDIFLRNYDDTIYWLETGVGELNQVAENPAQFAEMLDDAYIIDEWFLPQLVADLKVKGIELEPGKLYGFKQLPKLGGEYRASNFSLVDITKHFERTGKMLFKLKDLPEGTTVDLDFNFDED